MDQPYQRVDAGVAPRRRRPNTFAIIAIVVVLLLVLFLVLGVLGVFNTNTPPSVPTAYTFQDNGWFTTDPANGNAQVRECIFNSIYSLEQYAN